MAELYRYAAFVSYSSRDRAFSKRLHRALETYAIPNALGTFDITGGGKKNRVYPVFRDREELPAGDLGDTLEAALRASAALIVVCSPNSAASKWVDKEIAYFRSLGRGDRILCIVPDGVPLMTDGVDTVRTCFAPSLLRNGDLPLAADARKGRDGFRNAWLKIVAGIIRVNAGALQDRDRARRRRRAMIAGVAAAVALAAPAFAVWAYVLPQETYARSFVRVFGQPTPVDALTKQDASKREGSYRFVRHGYLGQIHKLVPINGSGACATENGVTSLTGDRFEFTCNDARACAIEVEHSGGKVKSEKIIDQFGNVLEKISYRNGGSEAIREEAVVGCSRLDNGVKFIEIRRGDAGADRGRDLEFHYFREPGKPQANTGHAYGYRFAYDPEGRRISDTILDKSFAPVAGGEGWATLKRGYDQQGAVIDEAWFGPDGAPVANAKGYARQTVERDTVGNPILVRNFAVTGEPASLSNGPHAWRMTFDAHGNRTALENLDVNETPVMIADGYYRWERTYDTAGWVSGERYFDTASRPAFTERGCVAEKHLRTATGETTNSFCLDSDGKPASGKEGYHERRIERDGRGNIVRETYFDETGGPTLRDNVVHEVRNSWDKNNRRSGSLFFGARGEPTTIENGTHGWRVTFDGNGFAVRDEKLDTTGAPGRDNEGVFAEAYVVDEDGRSLEEIPLGPDGEVLDIPEPHIAMEHDEFGRVVRQAYLDPQGAPTTSAAGEAGWRIVYDAYGRRKREELFDVNGEPTPGKDGAPVIEREFDSRGFPVRTYYRNAQGQLMPSAVNAAVVERDYDVRGRIVAYRALDASMRPVLRPDGFATQILTVDAEGHVTEAYHFGLNGEPVLNADGVHAWKARYDDRGNEIEIVYLGLDGAPKAQTGQGQVTAFRSTYDNRNRLTSVRYFGAEGEPQVLPDVGYGRSFQYDARGDRMKESTLGPDGSLMLGPDGVATTVITRDSMGREIQYDYLDASGAPLTGDRTRSVLTLNRFGALSEQRFTDAGGSLRISNASGRAIVRWDYDKAGRMLSEASFDASDKPVNRIDTGWFRMDRTYTPAGAFTGQTCSTTAGVAVPC